MGILAMYVPSPVELTSSIFLLMIALAVLCGIAYHWKLSVVIASSVMLVGSAIALTPDLLTLWGSDLGDYGDLAREKSSSNYSDTFFAITSYMHTGRGQLVAFGGMVSALVLHATIAAIIRRNRKMSDNGCNVNQLVV